MNFQYVEHVSVINININININITVIISQFTVNLLSYNVKISVYESLLCFHLNSETVVLIVRSLYCIFFFEDLALCSLFS